jgi:hypothetical protein
MIEEGNHLFDVIALHHITLLHYAQSIGQIISPVREERLKGLQLLSYCWRRLSLHIKNEDKGLPSDPTLCLPPTFLLQRNDRGQGESHKKKEKEE